MAFPAMFDESAGSSQQLPFGTCITGTGHVQYCLVLLVSTINFAKMMHDVETSWLRGPQLGFHSSYGGFLKWRYPVWSSIFCWDGPWFFYQPAMGDPHDYGNSHMAIVSRAPAWQVEWKPRPSVIATGIPKALGLISMFPYDLKLMSTLD